MKHYSDCFNKRSRFIEAPSLREVEAAAMPNAGGAVDGLAARLGELLQVQNDFFPCFDWTFPPPLLSKSEPPADAAALFARPSVVPGRYSIYLHSPFCKSLCSFCYYAVIPGRGSRMAEDYIDRLLGEMAMYREAMAGQVCESIYFGGGTPSFLDGVLLRRVFEGLHANFDIEADAEITVEASPGTLPRVKLELLRSLGVNRLSYGIQSLDEALLAGMNRSYSIDEAVRELTDAVERIGNVNVDTMYGFDGEHEDALLESLGRLHEIGVPSLSIYALDKQRSQSLQHFEPPKDSLYEYKIRQFARAEALLDSFGFQPVLQNVFVDPRRASYRHQVRRWDNLPLLALGMNAQGYAPRRPYQNIASIKSYCQAIDEGRLPVATCDELDRELEFCRELTSKLRFTWVSIGQMRYKYGVDLQAVFGELIDALGELGYLECDGDILRMTPKAAYYNNIIPMLFAPDAFKEKLLGLPEEYIEAFPVPYIMTRLGRIQSASFDFSRGRPERRHHTERRSGERRRVRAGQGADGERRCQAERRRQAGRRSSDRMRGWSITAGEQAAAALP
ncbi:coproporphyrinogen-III oxidase family protein [Thiohalobacter sp. IOR34]|uniref:coproporphyrinogen-III oxidase family protein n=1 Tax=Thiohalobacter sp. IOR34 TaxID=3057176 RepID=UPI0025B1E306|nr:coproporphyrinogen-III oxidase family protein [Thiohalobacter sp. IOR34]WJW75817.1 coproporphyrinogen-III oxidase family protein [Thiohalobacter sp. IOR34]